MNIKTWQERQPKEQNDAYIDRLQEVMQAEIDELRAALKAQPVQEPVALPGDLVIKALLAMDAEARKRGEMYPQTLDEQREDTKAVRNVIASLEFYTSEKQCSNGWPSVKDWPALPALKAQPVQPQPLEDLSGVRVCCGDYANCFRPCTPRGTWIAQQQAKVEAQPVQTIKFVGLDWDGVNPPTYAEYLASREAQPVQEPAGYAYEIFTENACNGKKTWQFVMGRSLRHDAPIRNVDKLYTTLVAQPVQPASLSDDQIENGYAEAPMQPKVLTSYEIWVTAVRWAEAAVRTGGAR